MKNAIICFFLGVVVSFYFFPVGLTILPAGLNTKMVLAGLGILLFVLDSIRKKVVEVPKDVIASTIFAVLFSVACFYSVTVNGTSDFSYALYVKSFFTWLFGAYSVCWILRLRYGKVSLHLLIRYLTWVAVAQCVSTLMIDNVPWFSTFVDSLFKVDQEFIRELDRMYGIGASLDPAGVRFSIILILLAYYFCCHIIPLSNRRKTAVVVFVYLFITFVGNMISRTTTVGAIAGIAYICFFFLRLDNRWLTNRKFRAIVIISAVAFVAVTIGVYLYNNTGYYENIRFAFEGFFNWVETGEWRTDSTDKLNREMWVWPEDDRTWLLGTGRFDGYAYGTDVGYCRFILYCGLLGFSIFCIFFVVNAFAFSQKYEGTVILALALLGLTFIVWLKVSTDIFTIYALFLTADSLVEEPVTTSQEIEEQMIETDEGTAIG